MQDELDNLMKAPSWITKYGISILFLVVLILVIVIAQIPYSNVISGTAKISAASTILHIKTTDTSKIRIGQRVFINVKNYPYSSNLKLTGLVENLESIENKVQPLFIGVNIRLNLEDSKKVLDRELPELMLGEGHILIEESSLFQRLIPSFYQ